MFGNVNVAILGTGNIAETMAKTLKKVRHAKLYAVGSRDLSRAKAFGRKYHFKKAYGSYEDLVHDKKVGLVYIATPISEHYENAKLCLENGKPVLLEKAFTANEEQAAELFRIAKENNVFITEAMWIRYMPFFDTIKRVLDSKVIGEPVRLTADLGYPLQKVARLNDPSLAGGALMDLGVYPLHLADMLFGDSILKINATCTYTNRHLDEQDSIAIVYRNGRMAQLSCSMLGISDRKATVVGTKGYFVIENINNFESLTVYDASGKKIAFYKRPKQKTGYEYEVQACLAAIKSGALECPEMPHEKTLSIMRQLDFIRSQTGIVWPFEKREEPADPVLSIETQTAAALEEEKQEEKRAETVEEAKEEKDEDEGAQSDVTIAELDPADEAKAQPKEEPATADLPSEEEIVEATKKAEEEVQEAPVPAQHWPE